MIVYLEDHKETTILEAMNRNALSHYLSYKEIETAFNELKSVSLRYDTKSGKTFRSDIGKVSEYVKKEDVPMYHDSIDASKWEFSGMLRNAAYMIKTGCKVTF